MGRGARAGRAGQGPAGTSGPHPWSPPSALPAAGSRAGARTAPAVGALAVPSQLQRSRRVRGKEYGVAGRRPGPASEPPRGLRQVI